VEDGLELVHCGSSWWHRSLRETTSFHGPRLQHLNTRKRRLRPRTESTPRPCSCPWRPAATLLSMHHHTNSSLTHLLLQSAINNRTMTHGQTGYAQNNLVAGFHRMRHSRFHVTLAVKYGCQYWNIGRVLFDWSNGFLHKKPTQLRLDPWISC